MNCFLIFIFFYSCFIFKFLFKLIFLTDSFYRAGYENIFFFLSMYSKVKLHSHCKVIVNNHKHLHLSIITWLVYFLPRLKSSNILFFLINCSFFDQTKLQYFSSEILCKYKNHDKNQISLPSIKT